MTIQTHYHEGDHGTVARIVLDKPKALNALSTEMIVAVQAVLDEWKHNDRIKAVWIEGAGDKAFCAGGDVVMLYHSMQETAAGDIPEKAAEFFTLEYRLDYTIHTYDKPIIIWADGIVMGGGLGIAVGGSHRIVTEKSMVAMPEVTIGLYPDVGASWFFQRMPGRTAEFLGMTGARMNAADALFTKLADHYLESENKADLLQALTALPFTDPHLEISETITSLGESQVPVESQLRRHFDVINDLMKGQQLADIVDSFKSLETNEKWLGFAQKAILSGCPMTLVLVQQQIQRAKHMSLKEVFQMELMVSTRCAMHDDLAEGIRALLIDKDGQPQWSAQNVTDISAAQVEEFFTPPWQGENPLTNL
ncbi:enoyl-CoA hydratase/isomerase family protein [Marinicella sp. W31]|uniref:enoyl-CoA hydratase/isomerase family protein n=1 Tax=Marinicella sp. W31 TaxID=3023713 RepID=UPI003757C04B